MQYFIFHLLLGPLNHQAEWQFLHLFQCINFKVLLGLSNLQFGQRSPRCIFMKLHSWTYQILIRLQIRRLLYLTIAYLESRISVRLGHWTINYSLIIFEISNVGRYFLEFMLWLFPRLSPRLRELL